ncbi:MAG: THUMP domain-containing protein [archaeon]
MQEKVFAEHFGKTLEKVFVLRSSSEIHLKTYFVRQFFLKKLISNLKQCLKNNGLKLVVSARFSGIIVCRTGDNAKAIPLMKKVFGIHSFSLAEQHVFSSLEELKKIFLLFAQKNLFEGDVFALRISRNGKHSFSSNDVAVECGQEIMDSINGLKVNLSKPSKKIFADIIGKKVFLYTEKFAGAKGIPVGVEGKTGLLMDGIKEELVSAFLMMKRGCSIFPVIKKMTPEIKKNLNLLSEWNSFTDFKPILLSEIKKEKAFLSALVSAKKETQLIEITELQEKTGFVVFFPLAFFPPESFDEILLAVNA